MSEDWNPGIEFAELSDVGMRRANNQDSMTSVVAKSAERFQQRGHLFVVADGMGAHAAGELASRMATETIAMQYFRSPSEDPIAALRAAVVDSNAEIHRRGQQNPEFHNMGTTASSMVVLPAGAVVAHVGDSRVYRLRRQTLEQLTFDHSLVWEMEASGQVHPNSTLGQSIPKNVITRSLGPNAQVEVDVEGPFPIQKGDRFLLCSDGLTGLVEDTEIGTLMDCLPKELAARVLVDLANLRGGPDNTTVIIVHVKEDPGNSSSSGVSTARNSNQPLDAAPFLYAGAGVFVLATFALVLLENYGPAVVTGVLAVIAAIAGAVVQLSRPKEKQSQQESPARPGGKGPYRKYSATATSELYQRLGDTVDALRSAAAENNWLMNWQQIDQLQGKGREALQAKDARQAIRYQSEAIVETMNQLRDQNNRAAGETAIDY